jgi:hypothetical protein
MSFNYVDVVGKGCDGWLNLFFEDHCIALVDNVEIANKIRKTTRNRNSLTVAEMINNLNASRCWDKKGGLYWNFKYGYKTLEEAHSLLET